MANGLDEAIRSQSSCAHRSYIGGRKEERAGEIVGFWVFKGLNKVGILKNYRPIHDSIVAKAMINSLSFGSGTYSKEQLFELMEK